jgi:hypothetical protein
VDWPVEQADITRAEQQSVDLQVEIGYVNFAGSRRCKRWFRELQCRYVYPKCGSAGAVCRQSCEDFVASCPGSDQSCASFPSTMCYNFSSASALASSSSVSWLLLSSVAAALYLLV